MWIKSIPGRGQGCKGPKIKAGLACSKGTKQTSVAGDEIRKVGRARADPAI